jgi:O-methyltransferase involved in polyketide biosynthesis
MAVALVDSISCDFGKFGFPSRQDVALRALAFDNNAHRYLAAHPAVTVVALAEGPQTSFHRLDAADLGGDFRWLTVDLPPIIELRLALLPHSPRISMCAHSALDFSWMDRVDPTHGVFITAEGLLMYLEPEQALDLIAECARRLPGGQMLFDLAVGVVRRTGPPRHVDIAALPGATDLVNTVPGIRAVHDLPLPPGRGRVLNLLLWTAQRLPLLDPVRGMLTLLEFG